MATTLPVQARARLKVWDLPLRVFHWLLVIAVALAFLSSEEGSVLGQWHVLSGWVTGILVVFRIAWGFVGGEHSRFADFVRPSEVRGHVGELLHGRADATLGHNALGSISVLLLLGLVATTVWTGVILAEDLHEAVAWTLLALVGIHVAAVILMSLLTRESLVAAMITGTKPAERHPGGRDARRPGLIGLVAGAAILGGTIYAVRAYDPFAFTLRSAEAYERGAETGRDGEVDGEVESAPEGDDHDG